METLQGGTQAGVRSGLEGKVQWLTPCAPRVERTKEGMSTGGNWKGGPSFLLKSRRRGQEDPKQGVTVLMGVCRIELSE